jgi:DNA-binding LytR/AlgR family response regulator
MESKLPEKHFARIHNSFIINKQKILSFQQSKVTLASIELPVGKKYADNISIIASKN